MSDCCGRLDKLRQQTWVVLSRGGGGRCVRIIYIFKGVGGGADVAMEPFDDLSKNGNGH